MRRTEVVIRAIFYLALLVNLPSTLVLGWILFVPGDAVCDGAVMSPGQTCELPLANGDSDEQMVTETTVRRALAYAAAGLAVVGIVGLTGIKTYRRKQGPAPMAHARDNARRQVLQHRATGTDARSRRTPHGSPTIRPPTAFDHPETLTWRYNLANVLVLAGDAARAISLYEPVAAALGRTLGPDHPDTFTAQAGVAYVHAMSADPGAAIPLAEGLLTRSGRILPEHDPRIRTINRSLSFAKARVLDDGGHGPRPPIP